MYKARPKVRRQYYIINEQIRGDKLRVINGSENLGLLDREVALKLAREEEKDLILIATPKGQPPVCKILELSKHKYHQQQKAQKAKAKSKQQELKEFRVGISTGEHDVNQRIRRAQGFLKKNDKVKFTLKFRGREAAHKELGFEKIKSVIDQLAEDGIPEKEPQMRGMFIEVTIIPK